MLLLMASFAGAPAQASADDAGDAVALPKLAADLTNLAFDDLLEVEVMSVSKRAERAGSAAAALFVLTGEEIHRSGARTIPEALRLVPGLEVARSGTGYAVSARGFLNTSADKMEVLLDGRSAYTPLTSAVFWDVLDTFLPDIDRIEVIRGPGATLWGANAVNGVINVITKSARDTQGVSLKAHAGNYERYGAGARLGMHLGDSGDLRLYSKTFARGAGVRADGSNAVDDMRITQTGFRSDWNPAGEHQLTVAGDYYQATENVRTVQSGLTGGPVEDIDKSGGNVLVRWVCCAGEDGRWSLQASYDGYHIVDPTIFTELRRTAIADFQQTWVFGAHNTLVYGAGYKHSRDETGGPPLAILFDPPSRTLNTYSAFVQDQISLLHDTATITLGSKFEHNTLSGFEVQPSIRFGWQASEALFTWAAVSRAVRTPNRLDQDIAIFCPEPDGFPGTCGPGLFRIGNPNLDSEKLIAYEWGLRLRTGASLSWDLATYFNDYSSLRSTEVRVPLFAFDNRLKAHGYGAELSVSWQPTDALEVRPSYNYLLLDVRADADSSDTVTAANLEGSNPKHQAGLLISYVPAQRWYVGGFLRYIGTLPRVGTPSATSGSTRVPAYAELSLRVAHTFPHNIELALAGQNLLHGRHAEFGSEASRSEVPRSVFLELRWAWQ
jgi:iron complex outermembrane recepter protein